MTKLYLPNNFDLSQFKRVGEASNSKKSLNKNHINYTLTGKYSIKAKNSLSLKVKAYLIIIFSLGIALYSNRIREARKGRKIRIIYLQSIKSVSLTANIIQVSHRSLSLPKSIKIEVPSKKSSRALSEGSLLSGLLNVQSFVREGADRNINGKTYNYGEVQGSQKLREAAASIARFNPELFSSGSLRSLNEFDPQLFRILQFKRIGHALGLEGDIPFPNDYTLSLIGFSETFTVSMILASFNAYMKEKKDLYEDWSEKDTMRIGEVLQKMLFQETLTEENLDHAIDTLNNAGKEDLVAFSTGHAWHVTQSFYLGPFFIHGNRGYGCDHPGFDVYQCNETVSYTRDSITDISNRHTLLKGIGISDHFANKGWNKIYTEAMSAQKVGNCSYTSIKAGLRFLLSWRYYCKATDESQPFDFCLQTKKMYKEWSRFDRELQIKDLLIDLKKMKDGEIEEYKEPLKQLYQVVMNSKTIKNKKISPDLITELESYDLIL